MTPQQLATLKATINANPTWAALPLTGAASLVIRDGLNADFSPQFFVWRSSVPTEEIFNAITWASLTPADTPDATVTYTNRALACQAKQINLQIMLQGRATLDTGKSATRQGRTDALQNVPAGAGGALLDAGWLGAGKVKATITRTCSVFEKAFATGTGTAGTPGVLVLEGPVSADDVQAARELP